MSRPRVEIRIRHGVTDLVQKVDPRYTVSPEAEELLNDLVDEFIQSITRQACRLAASRADGNRGDPNAEIRVEKNDFAYVLQRDWGILLSTPLTAGGARMRPAHLEALQAIEAAQAAATN